MEMIFKKLDVNLWDAISKMDKNDIEYDAEYFNMIHELDNAHRTSIHNRSMYESIFGKDIEQETMAIFEKYDHVFK